MISLSADLALLISLVVTVLGVGSSWATLGASVKELRRDVDENKRMKVSAEKYEGLEALMTVRLGGVQDELARLSREVHALRRERENTNPGRIG